MLRMIPPAGAPIRIQEIMYSYRYLFSPCFEELKKGFSQYLKTKHIFFFSSGRAGLSVILKALHKLSDRREVIIPAYTCFSVPSAIARVGLKITPCDIEPTTLDFSLSKLQRLVTEETLAIIPVHLFGLSSRIDEVLKIAKGCGACTISDVAQAMGARLHNQPLGGFGDVALFSLGRGKNITALQGGIIATNSDLYAQAIQEEMDGLDPITFKKRLLIHLSLWLYSIFLRPQLYWLPNSLPFLELGLSKFSLDYEVSSFYKFLSYIALSQLRNLDAVNRMRREKADYLIKGLKDLPYLFIPSPISGSSPCYLRLPVLIAEPDLREEIYRELTQKGIGVSKMYPASIDEIPEVEPYLSEKTKPCLSAQRVAKEILTLPTHTLVTKKDLDKTIVIFRKCNRSGYTSRV